MHAQLCINHNTMTNLFSKYAKRLLSTLAAVVLVLSATSCEGLYEQEDCPTNLVRFVFDMNMEYADGFSAQVKSVDLWIFEKSTGKLVRHFHERGSVLQKEGYTMELPTDIKAGDYTFLVWAGDIDNRHFKVNADNIEAIEHLTCRMERKYADKGPYSDEDLNLLFHGMLDAKLSDEYGTHTYTVYLMKDVNNVSLTLQHLSGQIEPGRLRITMADNNGSMYHHNGLDESDETITFHPWRTVSGTLDQYPDMETFSRASRDGSADDGTSKYADFMHTELTTARLMADHNPILSIYDTETDKTIFQIPVVKWATQLRSARYQNMDDQEYLDRENNYNMMVFLQDNDEGGWIAVSVVINGWHIIDNGDYVM